jgi:hypothetical protein
VPIRKRSAILAKTMRSCRNTLRIAEYLAIALTIASLGCGCASVQPPASGQIATVSPNTDATQSEATDQPAASALRRLPFSGRVVEGDSDALPPVIANSLSPRGPVTFAYREQLSHDEYHIPLIVSAFDPVTYIGAPLGDFGVTAFAALTIKKGDTVLGDYTAKAFVSRPYTLYSSPKHSELEAAARAAVRDKIDQQLSRDVNRLADGLKQAAAGSASITE